MGRSAVLLDGDLLIDYGIKPADPPAYPLNGMRPKAMVISHGHLDHCGLVPNLMDMDIDVYSTPVTKSLSALLANDTMKISGDATFSNVDIVEFERRARTREFNEPFDAAGFTIDLLYAGHIPGASSVMAEKDGMRVLYTGDINTRDTRLLRGADTRYSHFDVAVIESTYFGRQHPGRALVERRFIESVRRTVESGGTALIPSFAIGRTQEMLLLLDEHGISPYVDGMGVDVFRLLRRRPESVRDFRLLKKAYDNAEVVNPTERRDILDEPSVIVTTSGMLEGGPVLTYIRHLYDDPKSAVLLTGFQVEGTGGRRLVDTGIIEDGGRRMHLRSRVEQYDFSAHCGDAELKELVDRFGKTGVEKIITVHGDNCAQFAEWVREEHGIEAIAPQNGEVLYV